MLIFVFSSKLTPRTLTSMLSPTFPPSHTTEEITDLDSTLIVFGSLSLPYVTIFSLSAAAI